MPLWPAMYVLLDYIRLSDYGVFLLIMIPSGAQMLGNDILYVTQFILDFPNK